MRLSNNAEDRPTMKRDKFVLYFILLFISLLFIYGGCIVIFKSGDTDNDEIKHNDNPEVVLVGITSQAEISSTNAEDLVGGAFTAGLTNAGPLSSQLNRSNLNSQSDTFRPLRIPIILGDALRRIELDPAIIAFNWTNTMAKNGKLEGSCGGGFSYALELNRILESFYGYISFEDFCDDGISVTGDTDIEGDFDAVSGEFLITDFLFDNLTDGYLTLEGQTSIDLLDSPILFTFTAYITDEHTGKTYWFKNYSMSDANTAGEIGVQHRATIPIATRAICNVKYFDRLEW